jgi:hypothetical protein
VKGDILCERKGGGEKEEEGGNIGLHICAWGRTILEYGIFTSKLERGE